jgi:TfoX/Sxy family transcriptional regulator of competence genes
MPHNRELETHIRKILKGTPDLTEKRMFGGIAFLVNGNMAVGVYKESLVVRVGRKHHEKCLERPGTKPFDLTGKSMTGWVEVLPEGWKTGKTLEKWVDLGITFAQTLPAK